MGKGRALRGWLDNRGQTLVEFALVVSLLLAILFGITEFGRAWFYSNHLSNSVRAGARHAAVLGSSFSVSDVDAYVRREVGGFMSAADIQSVTVTVYDDSTPNTKAAADIVRGDTIKVEVIYNFHVLTGSIIPFFSGDRQIIKSASMRFEG